MNKKINIITFNAQGLTGYRLTQIKHFLDINPHIEIICVQETKFNERKTCKIPGYYTEQKNYPVTQGIEGKGGLITFIKHGIDYQTLSVDSPRDQNGDIQIEVQLFKIHLAGSPFHLVNLYSRGCDLDSLNKISSSFRTTDGLGDCVITGDFNAHHTNWGSQYTNRKGKDIYKWAEQENLVFMNDGTATRLNKANGSRTAIDLTITSPRFAAISAWGVYQDNFGSDHFPIVLSIGLNYTETETSNQGGKFIYDKADWPLFHGYCREITLDNVYSESVEIFCANLTTTFLELGEKCIPISSGKMSKHKKVPWWNSDCHNAVQDRKKALNQLKRNPCPMKLHILQEAELHSKKVILEAKKENWQEFCESVSTQKCSAKVFWQKIHRIKGIASNPVPLLKYKNDLAIGPLEKANFLVKHYQQVSSDSNMSPETIKFQQDFESQHQNLINEPGENDIPLNLPFSLSEFKSCISDRRDSAAGLDGISYLLFRHMPDSALELWLKLFNRIWSSGVYPIAWKDACVIPLYKNGKDKNEPKSYRPISLTSHSGKLLEGMVKARLEHHIESKNILTPFQSGFRKGRSTLDQLARLQHDVIYAKNRKRSVLAIFLDLQAAFDLTWHSGVLYKLKEYGITGSCFQYLRAFLEDRTIQVKVGSSFSEKATLDRGTPQGAILSPLLFSLIINGLPDTLQGTGMVISQFADDSGTWKTGSNLVKLAEDAQAGLDSLWGWAKNWGFKISETKTVGVLFGNQKQHTLNVNLGGTPIKFERVARFLGLLLDDRLSFTQHIKDLVTRCEKDLNVMRMLRGTDFGSDKNSLLLIYKSLIRSKIDYGAQIYSCAVTSELKKLDIVQNKALRLALGALHSTPGYLLEVEAGVPPLNIRRMEQTVKYWARVQTRHDGNPVNAILGTGYFIKSCFKNPVLPFGAQAQELAEACGLKGVQVADFRPGQVPPWTLSDPDIDTTLSEKIKKSDLPHLIKSELQTHIDENYPGYLQIFTDGSKCPNSGKVAAAVVIPTESYTFVERLTDKLSIYTAELLAIKKSLCWIIANKPPKSIILSDSLSSLVSLKSKKSQSRPDILRSIIELYNDTTSLCLKVTLVWCPAHVGISGNEQVDRAAKSGLNHDSVDNCVKLAPTEMYSVVRSSMLEKWCKTLDGRPFRQTYHRTSVGLSRPFEYSCFPNVEKAITRLRLGANLLPGNMGQYIIAGLDPICPECDTKYTTEHFLLHCTGLETHRTNLRAVLGGEGLDFNLKNILDPCKAARSTVFRAVAIYILDCEMSDKI